MAFQLTGKLVGPPKRTVEFGVQRSYIALATHPCLGTQTVRLKMLSGKRIANELIVAALAPILGVRVPYCFAVALPDAHPDAQHAWNENHYCFASVDVSGARNLAATLTLVSPKRASDFFGAAEWQPIVLLDALVANSDRTSSNVLLDGQRLLWAVDRETAFGGDWSVLDLQPFRHTTNLLARPGLNLPTQEMREHLIERCQTRAATVDFSSFVSRLPAISLLSETEARALSLYLAERWRRLDDLVRRALFSQH